MNNPDHFRTSKIMKIVDTNYAEYFLFMCSYLLSIPLSVAGIPFCIHSGIGASFKWDQKIVGHKALGTFTIPEKWTTKNRDQDKSGSYSHCLL
jgi:hypothetical protein